MLILIHLRQTGVLYCTFTVLICIGLFSISLISYYYFTSFENVYLILVRASIFFLVISLVNIQNCFSVIFILLFYANYFIYVLIHWVNIILLPLIFLKWSTYIVNFPSVKCFSLSFWERPLIYYVVMTEDAAVWAAYTAWHHLYDCHDFKLGYSTPQ
jgi:hypothetical protein